MTDDQQIAKSQATCYDSVYTVLIEILEMKRLSARRVSRTLTLEYKMKMTNTFDLLTS